MESLSRTVARLPARWRRALWLTEVEGREPDEMAALLGVDEAAAGALARRAREGLRLAYLLVRLRPGTPAECRRTVDRLPAYSLRALPPAVAEQVMDHLEACAFCRARAGELAELTGDLRGRLRPALLRGDIGEGAEEPAPRCDDAAGDDADDADAADAADADGDGDGGRGNGGRGNGGRDNGGRDNGERDEHWNGPGAGRRIPGRGHAVVATCATVVLVAVALLAVVSLRPGGTASRGASSPPPAAIGASSPATTRPGIPSPSARPTSVRPRVDSAAPGSARADDRRSGRRTRASVSRAPTAPGGGGAPPVSAAPAPKPATPPSAAPQKVCVGLLVLRLCHGVG